MSAVIVPPVQLIRYKTQPLVNADVIGHPEVCGIVPPSCQTALPKPSTSVNTLPKPGLAKVP